MSLPYNGTKTQLNITHHEINPPVSVIDYIFFFSHWPLGSHRIPLKHYIADTILNTVGFPPQFDGRSLLQKILHIYIIEHKSLLARIHGAVLEGVCTLQEEKSNHQSHLARNPVSYIIGLRSATGGN